MKHPDLLHTCDNSKSASLLSRRQLLLASLLSIGSISMVSARSSTASPKRKQPESHQTMKHCSHEEYMLLAIAAAANAPRHPFGAVIVDQTSGKVLATGFNRVSENPIFHGEIDAINRCALIHADRDWSNIILYTTAEPCPMCQSAIEWCGIHHVYYGTSIPCLKLLGWKQIDIRATEVVKRTPFRKTRVTGGILEKECNAMFEQAKTP